MTTYVILSLINGGYWTSTFQEFKGFLYAEHFDTEREARRVAADLDSPVTIVTVY